MDTVIKDYKISGEIGSGGMGTVYKAIHPGLKSAVIIKKLAIRDKAIEERFKREAKIMMSLRHDNIVSIIDYFIEGGSKYIVMEFIDGISLEQLILKKEKIDPRIAVFIFNEIARGLDYAHSKEVIHRDLKPSNILISRKGEVKIIDFGISSFGETQDDDKTKQALTKTGMLIGTPAYMSPEHLMDFKQVTRQSDIYSLGIIFYEMLTGKRLFGSSVGDIGNRLNERYAGGLLKEKVPAQLGRIIRGCLKPRPARRYKSISIPMKKLERISRKVSNSELKENIAEYVFKNGFAGSIEKVGPIYTSFVRSFFESRKRRFSLIASFASAALIALCTAVVMTDTHRVLFQRHRVGKLEIHYILPLPYFNPLPDKTEQPGPYRTAVEEARKALRAYIDANYKYALYNFTLRGWLFRLDSPVVHEMYTEEVVLQPAHLMTLTGDGYDIVIGGEKNIPANLILSTSAMFRPAGYYAFKIVLNNQAYWTYFHLDTLSTGKAPLVIDVSHKWTPKSKVTVSFAFTDAATGAPIADTEIKIFWYGAWLDWNAFSKNRMYTDNLQNGSTYFFSISHPDYDMGKWLRIDVGTDQTAVSVSMKCRKNVTASRP